jgi:hypothetical protein
MITSDNGRRVFCLQIAGLSTRYHSIVPPSSTNLDANITTSISYTDKQAIVTVGAFSSNIDPSGGIATYSPISIELSMLRDGTSTDPGIVFSRVGKRASSVTQTNLDENITFDSLPQTIDIDTDLTSFSVPRLIHVGAETFRASAFTSSTMTISDRAVGGTQYQSHEISLQGSSVPIASTEITIFRGRRAKLFIAHQNASGDVSDYTEIINGFIDSSPYVEEGDVISLSILPLVSMIDGKLADEKSGISYLLQGFHYYRNKSNVFEYGSAFRRPFNMVFSEAVGYPTPVSIAQTKLTIESPSLDLDNIYDLSLNNGVGMIDAHPRYPTLLIKDILKAYIVTATSDYIIIDHTITGAALQSSILAAFAPSDHHVTGYIPPRSEIKRYKLATNQLKRWPDVLNDKLSATTSHTGVNGAFHNVSFNGDNVIVSSLADQRARGGHGGRVQLFYSSSFYGLSSFHNIFYQAAHWPSASVEDRTALSNEYRVFYPLDYWMDGSKPNYATGSGLVKNIDLPSRRSVSTSSEVNIALAYKQANEDVILIEKSLGLPSSLMNGVFYSIQVDTFDYFTKEKKVLYYRATHETSVTFDGTNVGYLLHVPNYRKNLSMGHFGDWRGEDRTQITRGVLAPYISPGEMMLSILQSGGGGNNGDYDTLGVGLSIHESHIDVDSFLINGTANLLSVDSAFSIDDFDCREFIDSLLKSISCIITMKRSSGASKITLQALGTEIESSVAATIDNADMLTSPAPHFDIYDDIVTQINVKYGWDNAENKFMDTAVFNNQDAINRYGGEKSSINIDLYGLQIQDVGAGAGDIYNYLLPLASRVFNTLSYPMINWHIATSTGKSIYLDVGTYVKVSSPHLKSYSDSYGVTDGIGMIKSITQELMSEGCTLEVVHTGIKVVNWNSALKVTFVTSTNVLTVASAEFSDNDLSFFKVGDLVDFLPFADQDNSITGLEISSISGNDITFTAAHGVSTLGTLEPTTYNNASDDHKADAYLSNGRILGTSDTAQEYA